VEVVPAAVAARHGDEEHAQEEVHGDDRMEAREPKQSWEWHRDGADGDDEVVVEDADAEDKEHGGEDAEREDGQDDVGVGEEVHDEPRDGVEDEDILQEPLFRRHDCPSREEASQEELPRRNKDWEPRT